MLRGARTWTFRLAVAGVAAAALLPGATAQAAVGSDGYASAPPLLFSVPGTVGGNVGYTTSGEPLCPSMTRTAWWRIAGNGLPVTLSTALSNFDTVLAVYDAPTGIPITGNRLGCNDDVAPGDVTSALTFTATRGKSFLVQVGSNGADHGAIDVRAASARPVNDDRVAAQVLQTGAPATVSNVGASQELGETLTCPPASYAATLWFRWTAPAVGDAVFSSSAAFGDTVVQVYRASDGVGVGCAAGTVATAPVRVAAGDYLVQVGTKGSDIDGLGAGDITTTAAFTVDADVDGDGELDSTDCDDANPGIRHGAAEVLDDGIDQDCDGADAINLDRDGDGYNRPGDCNDANAAIHPQVPDVAGNAIDEDCTNGAAPYPRLAVTLRSFFAYPPLRFTTLTLISPRAGMKVDLRCRGARCFKHKVVKVTRSRRALALLAHVRKARLKRGAVVEVRITMAGHVGFVRRITVRGGRLAPTIRDLCLPVGAKRPSRCP